MLTAGLLSAPAPPCSDTVDGMPVALITGAARANSIAAGIAPRLISDGWDVVTSDLQDVDYVCDLSSATGPEELISAVTGDRGPISALILSHAHDIESGIPRYHRRELRRPRCRQRARQPPAHRRIRQAGSRGRRRDRRPYQRSHDR